MPPLRRPPYQPPSEPTVEDLSTYEKANQTAMYLAERIESIKKAHQSLKKLERTGHISPLDRRARVGYIRTVRDWLISDCESYAEKLGIAEGFQVDLMRIVRRGQAAMRSARRGERVWGRDYLIVKATTYCQGWLYENGFIFGVQRPPPDFTEELKQKMLGEARAEHYREHPPKRLKRSMDRMLGKVQEALKDVKLDVSELENIGKTDTSELEKIDKGIEDLDDKDGDEDATA